MAIISGLCHVFGCRGKRPVRVKNRETKRKFSTSLIENKKSIPNRKQSVVGEH